MVFVNTLFAVLLMAGAATAQPVTVLLVRHAEKAAAPADNPPLTEAGRARAKLLASVLQDVNLTAVYTSEFARTRATAQPVAAAQGLTITEVPSSDSARLTKLVAAQKGKTVLVVGHTNTVPTLVRSLGGPSFHIDESEFDKLFVLTVHAPGQAVLVTLRYGQVATAVAAASSMVARPEITRVTLRRFGGIAANIPLMANALGDVRIHADGTATLSSRRSPAETPVSEGEIRGLLSALDLQALVRASARAKTSAGRDEYRYTLTFFFGDGRSHSVEFGDSNKAEVTGSVPGLGPLIEWFQTRAK